MAAADDLLNHMRRTADGWGEEDFRGLYKGFGFQESGTKHWVYIHPKYRHLRATVARHRRLPRAYARQAVKVIDELMRLEASEARRSKEEQDDRIEGSNERTAD